MSPSRALLLSLVSAVVCAAGAARAEDTPSPEEERSLAHYQKGVTAYDLGKFDEAVQEFQKAYEVKPTPAYLYNIAQAHRQKGDGKKALFFYKRYLQKAPAASNRATVERRIAELEEQLKKQEEAPRPKEPKEPKDRAAARGKEPLEKPVAAAAPRPSPAPAREPAARAAADTRVSAAASPSRSMLRLALEAGPAFMSLGDGPDVPVQLSVFGGIAYTIHLGDVALDLGVAASLTPVPFEEETVERAGGTSLVVGALGNLALRFPVGARFAIRAEAGGGVALWIGLVEHNPFTDGGAESGSELMPHVRVALGLDVALGAALRLTLTPAFTWSPAPDTFEDEISSITRIDVLAGVAVTL